MRTYFFTFVNRQIPMKTVKYPGIKRSSTAFSRLRLLVMALKIIS